MNSGRNCESRARYPQDGHEFGKKLRKSGYERARKAKGFSMVSHLLDRARQRSALACCAVCQVAEPCLFTTLVHEEATGYRFGVWGHQRPATGTDRELPRRAPPERRSAARQRGVVMNRALCATEHIRGGCVTTTGGGLQLSATYQADDTFGQTKRCRLAKIFASMHQSSANASDTVEEFGFDP
jgi:hypothetical protein